MDIRELPELELHKGRELLPADRLLNQALPESALEYEPVRGENQVAVSPRRALGRFREEDSLAGTEQGHELRLASPEYETRGRDLDEIGSVTARAFSVAPSEEAAAPGARRRCSTQISRR